MTLDGPLSIYARDPVTGALLETLAPGVHYKTEPVTFAAFSALLTPYRVTPVHPLQNVWAGDDPAHPTETVALRFPDGATASAVIAQIGAG